MNKTALIGMTALLCISMMFVIPGGKALSPVRVGSGYCDVDSWSRCWSENNSFTVNVTFPNDLSYFNNTNTTRIDVRNNAASWHNITYNITVNGNAVASSIVAENGTTDDYNLTKMAIAGVNLTAEYMNITFNASSATSLNVTLIVNGTDVPLSSAFIAAFTETEPTIGNITVGENQACSAYHVKDKIVLTNPSNYINMTDVVCNITYPSAALNSPTSSHTWSTVNISTNPSCYIYYQKWGPYIYEKEIETESSTGKKHATLTIYSPEATGSNVYWLLDPTSEDNKEYFPSLPSTLSTSNMAITINENVVTWTPGSILFDDIALSAGYNEFDFRWTPTSGSYYYYPSTTLIDDGTDNGFFYNTDFYIPNWAWMLIGAMFLIALIVGVAARRRNPYYPPADTQRRR